MVVDRLSSVYIGAVTVVTGGKVISSFSVGYPSNWLGALTNITPMVIKDRRCVLVTTYFAHPYTENYVCKVPCPRGI